MSGKKKVIHNVVETYYLDEPIDFAKIMREHPNGKGKTSYDCDEPCFQVYTERLETDEEYLKRMTAKWRLEHVKSLHHLRKIVESRNASDDQERDYLKLLKTECPKTIEELEAWSEEKS